MILIDLKARAAEKLPSVPENCGWQQVLYVPDRVERDEDGSLKQGGHIYCFGGTMRDKGFFFSFESLSWSPLPDLPQYFDDEEEFMNAGSLSLGEGRFILMALEY